MRAANVACRSIDAFRSSEKLPPLPMKAASASDTASGSADTQEPFQGGSDDSPAAEERPADESGAPPLFVVEKG